jgi:Domain of unknown function (DUF4349)
MTSTRKLLAVGAVGLLLAAGCSSTNSGKNSDSAGSAPMPAAGGGAADSAAGEKAAPGTDMQAQQQNGQSGAKAPVYDRAIIYTGQITVRVEHVDVSAERIRSLATSSGGFVASEKSARGDGGRDESAITIRVPASKFGDILDQIGRAGDELDRSISTEDVTEQVADLDAQITATRTSVDSVRRLLAQAKDLNQILLLEKELTTRQAALDSLVGKKRRLDEQVALSTVTVSLLGPEIPFKKPKPEEPSFLGGLHSGWEAFLAVLQVAAAVLGFLIPFLVVAALVGVPLIWWLRRKRRPAVGPAE